MWSGGEREGQGGADSGSVCHMHSTHKEEESDVGLVQLRAKWHPNHTLRSSPYPLYSPAPPPPLP